MLAALGIARPFFSELPAMDIAVYADFALSAFATLFVTIDPVGLAPLFVALTAGMSLAQRREVALRATLIATGVLLLSAFGGKPLLDALGISVPAFRIAGGLLLFIIAVEMVFERRAERKQNTAETAITRDHIENLAAFPLAVPLMAGPGAITAAILLRGQAGSDPVRLGILVACIAIIVGLCLTTFLLAARIDRMLGITGRVIITRLLGVILAALAVQFVADGLFLLIEGRA